jgi:hypothetical protein
VSSFDVRVFAIRRRPGHRVFEVRWRIAGGGKSRSFITRALADSYRAELIRAARRGLEFDLDTGEPLAWAAPAPLGPAMAGRMSRAGSNAAPPAPSGSSRSCPARE